MVKRDGAFTRSERIREIRRWLLRNKEPLSLRRTLAVLQMKHGLTKEKIREYLGIIEDLGEISVEESTDQIVVNGVAK